MRLSTSPPGSLAGYVQMLREGPYLGANVTVPRKLAVAELVDQLDGDARVLRAVNTIVAADGRLVGHNTDPAGALSGLLGPVGGSLPGSIVLLLGAGGAARAFLLALSRSEAQPALVLVAARTVTTAQALTDLGRELGLAAGALDWDERAEAAARARVLVNCTPLGLLPGEDPLAGTTLAGKVVLDLAYRPGGTDLFARAWREGAMAVQGEEMLLHQGARSFTLWTGLEAPLEPMRRALRQAMTP